MFKVLSKKSESSESASALTAVSSSSSSLTSSGTSNNSPSSSGAASNAADPEIVLTNGPLSYKYSLSHLELHFGREMTRGSEHSIDGLRFPAEIQLYFYNSQLYNNWEDAVIRTHGAAAVAILIQLNSDPKFANSQLKRITHALRNITSKGQSVGIFQRSSKRRRRRMTMSVWILSFLPLSAEARCIKTSAYT